jgi:hypothetical protein
MNVSHVMMVTYDMIMMLLPGEFITIRVNNRVNVYIK